MKKSLTPGEALNKAAAYCTLCERCISEVCNKLTSWGVASEEQHSIIARLKKEGFIDEARYCRAFVNDKVRFNHWGRIKIAAALREKQLPGEAISDAMEQIDEKQYLESLTAVIANKRKELKGKEDYPTQQKLIHHAASRGFELPLILQTIKYKGDEMDF